MAGPAPILSSSGSHSVSYMRANPRTDKPVLFKLLLHEKLNFLTPFTCDVEKSVVVARDTNSGALVGGAKLGQMNSGVYQLSSVVVDEAYRGCGIGKKLVRRALELAPADATVFLTTLEDRRRLYEMFGFLSCELDGDEIPASLRLEMAIGAAVFGTSNLIVMRRN